MWGRAVNLRLRLPRVYGEKTVNVVLQTLGVVLEVLEAAVGLTAFGHAHQRPAAWLVDGNISRAQRDLELIAPEDVSKEKFGDAWRKEGCKLVREVNLQIN